MLHALGIEGGVLVVAIPVTMLLLDIPLLAALIMDSGFLLFFLCYTYGYNRVWDKFRHYSISKLAT